MAKHPYTLVPSKKGLVPKPLITAQLCLPKTHKITSGIRALLDSGSDMCLCSMEIGIWLGVKVKGKKPYPIKGINNQSSDTYVENVKITVSDKTYVCPMHFSNDLPLLTPLILGQKGFFDHFKVTFDLRNLEIEII